jgi:hypothetical protein
MINLAALASGARLSTFTEKVKELTSYLETTSTPIYIPGEHPGDLAAVQATRDSYKSDADSNPLNVGSAAQYRLAASTVREATHSAKSRGGIKSRAAFSDFEKHWVLARIGINTGEDS